ncbi:MAG: serine/threonine protein kinase [Labilithrix sp.]|nr:serine/threonine protein kinase [Labilithrix sp.]MCW5809390.1 serine/threonine protein kinase [Labilithrix sp.]
MKRYRIERLLASGGMADLYLARDGAGQEVAIKRVKEHLQDEADLLEMFLREAEIAARLRHPNIVEVCEVGEEDGLPYIVMPRLFGRDLRSASGLGPREACLVGAGVARGLAYAHGLRDEADQPYGIVHRDVSPTNIFVTRGGEVRLLDFGIAKTNRFATATGLIRGKAGYMAPEQLSGLAVDARTDLFALGVVLWELLASRPLWRAATETGVARAVMEESAPPIEQLCPAAAGDLARLVARLVAKFPAARPTSVDRVADTLEELAKRHGSVDPGAELAHALFTHHSHHSHRG